MDAELEKLVESGKLTTKAAEQLEQLRPGSFCLHKSWGFGQVAEWNLLLNQIVIDFKTKAKHPMQLAYSRRPFPARAREGALRAEKRSRSFSMSSKIFLLQNCATQRNAAWISLADRHFPRTRASGNADLLTDLRGDR
jgi:hypothetical protein